MSRLLQFIALFASFLLACTLGADTQDDASQADEQAAESEAVAGKPVSKKKKASKPSPELPPNMLVGDDIHKKDGVIYHHSWAVRSGVTKLQVPAYEGWSNLTKNKGAYADFARMGRKGETLSAVLGNIPFMEATGSRYLNFICLIWIPEEHAYKLYTPRSFEPIKQSLREQIIERRRATIKREDFVNFEDYINFRFGRDEDMEDFVDGYRIEASQSDAHLTHFFTSQFVFSSEEETIREPMLGTSNLALIRNKLIRIEIRMLYRNDDDIIRILEFTDGFMRDMRAINSP